MIQQGLLLFTGAVGRLFESVGFFLRVIADGIRRVFLGIRFPFERVFPHLFLARVTGDCAEPQKGGAK